MGEVERLDPAHLVELYQRLPDEDKGALVHLAEHLARKATREGGMSGEDRAWLESSAADLSDRLVSIEADIPPGEIAAWLTKMSEGAVPVHYNSDTGELEEVRP